MLLRQENETGDGDGYGSDGDDSDYEEYKLVFLAMWEFKFQVVIAREDLQMSAGKLAAQAVHAVLDCCRNAMRTANGPDSIQRWQDSGEKTVVLKATDATELCPNSFVQ